MNQRARRRESTESDWLERTQRWMQACIMADGSAEQAVRTPAATREFPLAAAARIVKPSATLEPLERLDIYRGMYELRLRDALEADYPALHRFLGDNTFEELVRLYIAKHPSRSYTLNRLGDHLPDFIENVEGLPRPAFARDLARLELARTLVFDEEESGRAEASVVRDLPQEAWTGLRLRPIRALRLLELDYPAHRYLEAMREGSEPPRIVRRKCWLAVFRRDYAIFQMPLARVAHDLLAGLVEGLRLGQAMERAFESGKASNRMVFRWFQDWFSEGLFAAIEV